MESEQLRQKGIYLLPNVFTTAGLFSGFYAIVAAMKGSFSIAAVAIFIAMIADSLDGRVARLTKTQSAFGAEYDSLSDMVTFGVAPALFAYSWGLHSLGKLGWLAAFFYAAATALRLARFNTQTNRGTQSKRYFQGLPCPSAAGLLTATLWVMDLYHLQNLFCVILVAVVAIGVAVLQMSNIQYRSFKDSDFKNKVPFLAVLLMLVIFVAIALDPPEVLLALFFVFVMSGPVAALIHLKKKKQKNPA